MFKFYSLAAVSAVSAFTNIPIGNNQHQGTFSYLAAENMAVVTLNSDDCSSLSFNLNFSHNPFPFVALNGESAPASPTTVCPDVNTSGEDVVVGNFAASSEGKCTSVTVLDTNFAESEFNHEFASFSLYNGAQNENVLCGNLISKELSANDNDTIFRTRDRSDYVLYSADTVDNQFIAYNRRGCRGGRKSVAINHDDDWTYFPGAKENGKIFKSIKVDGQCIELKVKFGKSERSVSMDHGDEMGVNLEFTQNSIFEPTYYHYKFDCPAITTYTNGVELGGYHIHVDAIQGDEATQRDNSQCGATGKHWNPYSVKYDDSNPNPSNDFEFEIGDNAKRYGTVQQQCLDHNGAVDVTALDWNFPLFGDYNFNERSVVFHAAQGGARTACRNLSEN